MSYAPLCSRYAADRLFVYVILYVCKRTHDTGINPSEEQRLKKKTNEISRK